MGCMRGNARHDMKRQSAKRSETRTKNTQRKCAENNVKQPNPRNVKSVVGHDEARVRLTLVEQGPHRDGIHERARINWASDDL